MAVNCTNKYFLGCIDVCTLVLELPTGGEAPSTGLYKAVFQYLNRNISFEFGAVSGELITIPVGSLNERFLFCLWILDENGDQVSFTIGGDTYDCFSLQTQPTKTGEVVPSPPGADATVNYKDYLDAVQFLTLITSGGIYEHYCIEIKNASGGALDIDRNIHGITLKTDLRGFTFVDQTVEGELRLPVVAIQYTDAAGSTQYVETDIAEWFSAGFGTPVAAHQRLSDTFNRIPIFESDGATVLGYVDITSVGYTTSGVRIENEGGGLIVLKEDGGVYVVVDPLDADVFETDGVTPVTGSPVPSGGSLTLQGSQVEDQDTNPVQLLEDGETYQVLVIDEIYDGGVTDPPTDEVIDNPF